MDKETVHIVPLGYEYDRIIEPVIEKNIKENIKRVYILTHKGKDQNDEHDERYNKIKEKLNTYNINTIKINHDRENIQSISNAVDGILIKEKNNKIKINLSSGSKIQSIITIFTAMRYNNNDDIEFFYAYPVMYSTFDKEPKGVNRIELIKFNDLIDIMKK